uniref:Uncharacterized protein n=1 Tax=Caenorhabditis japonica TaxID=281687 RepID=A0A8R1IPN5_CAEJA
MERVGSTDEVELEPSPGATIHLDMSVGGGAAEFNPFGAIDDVRFNKDEELPDALAPAFFSKYGDFHTIDWQRDLARDRLRHKMIAKKKLDPNII